MALSPEQLKAVFSAAGKRANRALGQNFCTDGQLLSECVSRAGFPADTAVLEVGPGLGALTEELLKVCGRVVAVEKDAFLAETLRSLLPDGRLEIVQGDILRVSVRDLFPGSFSVAGNLPYYITTPVLEKFLPLLPDKMLVMLQKEAAARFTAGPGDRVYGPVPVLTQCFYSVEFLTDVSPDRYYPQPDVVSSVVLLNRNGTEMDPAFAKGFQAFLNTVFAKRRKTLVNNLPGTGIRDILTGTGLPPDVRAEAVPPETLLRIHTALLEKEM